jgi:GWxTD domain-containing protein
MMVVSLDHTAAQKRLKAKLAYNTFWSPTDGPYLETYLSVDGNSVVYRQQAEGKFQAELEVTVQFMQDGKITYADKYILLSPPAEKPEGQNFNFLDQQRYALADGKYDLEIIIADRHAEKKNAFQVKLPIEISFPTDRVTVSDIQLIESYSKAEKGQTSLLTKSGYNLIPYVDNYYPPTVNTIRFYTEIYHTSSVIPDEMCLITYHIETYEQQRIMEKFRGFTRRTSASVIPLLGEFPIGLLPSGNYYLTVEVRNKKNEILAFRQCAFIRFSPQADSIRNRELEELNIENTFAAAITHRDSLMEYILSLRPIATSQEITFHTNQLKVARIETMQKFFYDFWHKRNPENPAKAWQDYHEEVKKVNAEFSTRTFKGYDTDRGRIYLKYGPPNTRTKEYHEPSAYPYEIWHYYKIGNQMNRKFIFYNTDLVTNNFTILYSDVIGEQTGITNWQAELHRRDTPLKDDGRNYIQRDFTPGNNVFKNFENPR